MLISNLTLSIVLSLIYMIGLSYLYFSKARINNGENKIYKCMIIFNIFGLILQFLCDFVSLKYHLLPNLFSDAIFRLYLVYFLVWLTCMIIYLISITFENKNKLTKTVIISCIIFILIDLFFPYSLYRNVSQKTFYTYGLAIDFVYFSSALGCILMGFILFLKRKFIPRKKVYQFICSYCLE